MSNVSNDFKIKTKKTKTQSIKLGIVDGESTVKEIHFMTAKQFNLLPVWMLRKRQEVIAKELKYSFEGKLFKTIMKQIEITVKNAGELKDKNVNFQYGLYINNDFEYIDLGDYYIKDVEDDRGKSELVVTGYDKMLNFMVPFKQSDLQLTYPCPISTLVQRIGDICGVELYSLDFFNSDLLVDEDFFTAQELTYRDVLDKVAEATLTVIFIKDNKLYLHKLVNSPVEKLDTSYITRLTVKEKFGPLNALVLGRGDVEDNIEAKDDTSINQNGRCEIRFDENEFVEYKREQVIDAMFEQIKGIEYYAFEGSDLGVMWIEPGDLIELSDREGNTYKTFYLKANVTINTGISSDMQADIPEETNTEYKVTTKEEKKTLKVERLAKKNEGLIQDLIQETSKNTEKLSEHKQTIDGITDKVTSVETKVETVETKADNAQSTADETSNNLKTNYYTKTETNSQITQKADEITSEVSKTYSTKTETTNAKNDAISSANASTDEKLKGYSTTTQMNSAITQKADEINSVVSKKVGDSEIISKINQSAEQVKIDAQKLNINGVISANGNFEVDTDGTLSAVNANLSGKFQSGDYPDAENNKSGVVIQDGRVICTDIDIYTSSSRNQGLQLKQNGKTTWLYMSNTGFMIFDDSKENSQVFSLVYPANTYPSITMDNGNISIKKGTIRLNERISLCGNYTWV